MAQRPVDWRRRLELATRRLHKWREEWQVLFSKEQTTRSKSWQTRYRKARERARRNVLRAQRDKLVAEPKVQRAVELRKPVRHGVEYVLKVDYKGPVRPRDRHRDVFWDVRLRKAGSVSAEPNELRHVVAQLKTTGTPPVGWEVTEISWGRGDRALLGEPDRSGMGHPADDLGALSPTLFRADKVDWTEVGEEEV